MEAGNTDDSGEMVKLDDEKKGPTSDGDDEDDSDQIQMKRQLGLASCVAIIVGLTIGTGIHVGPSGIFRKIESPGLVLLTWAVGAFVNMFGGLTFAELACTFPHAGERYHYLQVG